MLCAQTGATKFLLHMLCGGLGEGDSDIVGVCMAGDVDLLVCVSFSSTPLSFHGEALTSRCFVKIF